MGEDVVGGVLWSPPVRGRRGPTPRVDRVAIVEAAIRIADAEGLDSASMQRIGAEVGVTKMALYRHLPDRAALVALMIEMAMGPAPQTTGRWAQDLRTWARTMKERLTAHRWLSAAAAGPRLFGPVELGWVEAGLTALAEIPLTDAERLDTLNLIGSHVRGVVLQQSAPDGGVSDDVERAIGTALTTVLAGRTDFPRSAAAFSSASADETADQAYAFGLDRILAGIESLVAERRPD